MLSSGRLAARYLALVAVLAMPSAARAEDTWSTPFPGVQHLHRVTSAPLNVHALVVNLCAVGIRPRATRPSQRRMTTSSFGKLIGAQAAINGDFFSYDTYKTTGLSIGFNERWTDTSDPNFEGFIAFGIDAADFSDSSEVVGSNPPEWMRNVVSGRPQVMKDGVAITDFNCDSPGGYCLRDPRTGVGISEDRKTLYLAVVNGRNPSWSRGMTSAELGAFMKELGAHDALSLDSGGSTTMWLSGSGVLNKPSDGSERVVANHLAIFADGTTEALACVNNAIIPTPDAGPDSPDGGGDPAAGDGSPDPGGSGSLNGALGCRLVASGGHPGGLALVAFAWLLVSRRRRRSRRGD